MSTDKNINNLILNRLTKEQYEAIQSPDPDQLYFIEDDTVEYTAEEKAKLGGLANIKTIGENLALDANGVLSALGGEAVHTLTTDDYNYPTNNPDGVAVWLLDPGIYNNPDGLKVYGQTNGSSTQYRTFLVAVVTPFPGSTEKYIFTYFFGTNAIIITGHNADASWTYNTSLPYFEGLSNSLNTTSPNYALDARQGKVLKDLIDTRVPAPTAGDADKFLKGDGTWGAAGIPKVTTEPDISTVGEPGDVLVCTETGNVHMFMCTAADTVAGEYTWQRLAFMNDIQLIVSQNALSVGGGVDTSNHTLDASDTTATLGDNALNI